MADYNALLESSSYIKASREKEIAELRSQLAAEETRFKELDEEFWDQGELLSDRAKEIAELRSELADLKQNSESDFDSAGKAGELVSWLRKEVGKALPKHITVKAVQKILEGGDN